MKLFILQIIALISYPGTTVLMPLSPVAPAAGMDGLLAQASIMYAIMAIPAIFMFISSLLLNMKLAECFGKQKGYGLYLTFLPFLGYPGMIFKNDFIYIGPSK